MKRSLLSLLFFLIPFSSFADCEPDYKFLMQLANAYKWGGMTLAGASSGITAWLSFYDTHDIELNVPLRSFFGTLSAGGGFYVASGTAIFNQAKKMRTLIQEAKYDIPKNNLKTLHEQMESDMDFNLMVRLITNANHHKLFCPKKGFPLRRVHLLQKLNDKSLWNEVRAIERALTRSPVPRHRLTLSLDD